MYLCYNRNIYNFICDDMAEEVSAVAKKSFVKPVLIGVGALFLVVIVAVVSGGGAWLVGNKKTEELQSKYDKLDSEKKECLDDLDLCKEEGNDECECLECECEECEECKYSEDLVLPQVNYIAKLYYTEQDLDDLQERVIDPIVQYYEGYGMTVVSIDIDNDNRGGAVKSEFTVSVIISKNDGTDVPLYLGFVHTKVSGEIPYWAPISAD